MVCDTNKSNFSNFVFLKWELTERRLPHAKHHNPTYKCAAIPQTTITCALIVLHNQLNHAVMIRTNWPPLIQNTSKNELKNGASQWACMWVWRVADHNKKENHYKRWRQMNGSSLASCVNIAAAVNSYGIRTIQLMTSNADGCWVCTHMREHGSHFKYSKTVSSNVSPDGHLLSIQTFILHLLDRCNVSVMIPHRAS